MNVALSFLKRKCLETIDNVHSRICYIVVMYLLCLCSYIMTTIYLHEVPKDYIGNNTNLVSKDSKKLSVRGQL